MTRSSTSNSEHASALLEPPLAATDAAPAAGVDVAAQVAPPQEELPRAGFPWAMFWALVILAGVELAVRSADPRNVIPYKYGEGEHHAVAAYIDALGPADVCFVGSSTTREAVLAAEVRRRCERAKLPVTVANYGLAGLRTDGMELVIRRLLAHERKPRLIVCGVTARELRAWRPDRRRLAIFWSLPDWARNTRSDPAFAGPQFPNVLRQEIARRYLTLRYRDAAREWLAARVGRDERQAAPILGDSLTPWHLDDRSLKTREMPEGRIEEYLEQNRLNDPNVRAHDAAMHAAFVRLMNLCREAGVPLIVFQPPLSDMMKESLPDGVYSGFLDLATRLTREAGVRFVPPAELETYIGDGGFREFSHLNHKGAQKFTKAIADRVVIPALKEQAQGADRR